MIILGVQILKSQLTTKDTMQNELSAHFGEYIYKCIHRFWRIVTATLLVAMYDYFGHAHSQKSAHCCVE